MINRDRLVSTFMELVQIDSPSGHEKVMADHCKNLLEQLGGTTQFDSHGNLIATFAGTGEPLILNAHLDTVEPGRGIKPKEQDGKIISDGTTILGGDAKAGVAVIIETLTSLEEENKDHLPLEIVLTLGEEWGLEGARNLDYSLLQSKRAITFDGEEGIANVIIGSPGYNQINITVIGRSAHAGVEPEKGLSAITIAAEIITQLQVGRIEEKTTANIGLISGGIARNAVPEQVTIAGEIRSNTIEKLEKHTQLFRDVINDMQIKNPEAKIAIEVIREFDPYTFTDKNTTLQLVTHTLERIGLTPNLHYSGGGTDVNMLHTHGVTAICVGAGGYEMHTKLEYVEIGELMGAAQFCEKLVQANS